MVCHHPGNIELVMLPEHAPPKPDSHVTGIGVDILPPVGIIYLR